MVIGVYCHDNNTNSTKAQPGNEAGMKSALGCSLMTS